MKLFVLSETLTTGGAEWFSLRLTAALMKKGHSVYFFVLRPDIINEKIVQKFPQIKILSLPLWKIKLLVQADRVVKKLLGKNIFIERANVKFIKRYIKAIKPDALHSHLIEADLVAMKAAMGTECRVVTTVHGDYSMALKQHKREKEITELMQGLSHIAVISDEQQEILSQHFPQEKHKISKIYNGYPLETSFETETSSASFTFGMIARGIPEKGWTPLIKAFQQLSTPNVQLHLYGDSDYLQQLKNENQDARIHFFGFTNEPLKAIQTFDVGMFPSQYAGESLPTTIIEYLAMQKPVIANDIGEVGNMLQTNHSQQQAGIVIHPQTEAQMIQQLYEAMNRMLIEPQYYEALKGRCQAAFEKFSMESCIEAYEACYKGLD